MATPPQMQRNAVPLLGHIRSFFFDLDGTLADSASGLSGSIALAFTAVERPLPVEDITPYIGPGIRTILANMDPTLTPAQIDGMEQAFRSDYDTNGVLRTDMFSGTSEVLQALKNAGAQLYIITNKPQLATSRLLAKHGLTGFFQQIVSRNSREPAYTSKGEMLRTTMLAHAAYPETSLMIGDTEEDAQAAREAGMPFAHAGYGYGDCASATVSLHTIRDLLNYCIASPSSAD